MKIGSAARPFRHRRDACFWKPSGPTMTYRVGTMAWTGAPKDIRNCPFTPSSSYYTRKLPWLMYRSVWFQTKSSRDTRVDLQNHAEKSLWPLETIWGQPKEFERASGSLFSPCPTHVNFNKDKQPHTKTAPLGATDSIKVNYQELYFSSYLLRLGTNRPGWIVFGASCLTFWLQC